MFPNRRNKRKSTKGILYKKVYLTKEKIYNFGPLLIISEEMEKELQENKSRFLNSYKTKFRFTNISPFVIKINFKIEEIPVELSES